MSTVPKRNLTEQEYLEIERAAEFKSEFYRGEMFRMQGATREHVVISGNIHAELHYFFKGGPCEVYHNDMRLKVKPSGLYTYPDVMATCQQPEFADNEFDNFVNPQVIFEVLSKSTEKYDRTFKLDRYQELPSVKSYLLVAQDQPRVEQYARSPRGEWIYSSAHVVSETLRVECIGYELRLSEVYAQIEFPDDPPICPHLIQEKDAEYVLPRPGTPVTT